MWYTDGIRTASKQKGIIAMKRTILWLVLIGLLCASLPAFAAPKITDEMMVVNCE